MILRKKKEKAAAAKVEVKPVHYGVILGPVITEKSTTASEQGKVVFRVRQDASKTQIKEAAEALFGVQVTKVNTSIRMGKQKRFRGTLGRQSDTKKAVLTLAQGQTIDIAAGVK